MRSNRPPLVGSWSQAATGLLSRADWPRAAVPSEPEVRSRSSAGFWFRRAPIWTLLVIAVVALALAGQVIVGADTMWMVALGDNIGRTGHLPVGLPFAVADTRGWAAVPALGAVLLSWVHRLGPLALPAAQLVVDLALLGLLAVGARRAGARDGASAAVLAVFAVGALPALGVVRGQTLSLIPFALLLLLLREESRRPSLRVWLLVPLVAVWGNLHGAVLLGVAVAGCYLLARRWRSSPWTAAGVGVAMMLALLANPAGVHAPAYYYGVFTNATAQRKLLLWAPLRLDAPFDLLLAVTALALIGLAAYARRPVWEYLALAGLAVATASAARNGIWLGLLTTPPAAQGLTRLHAAISRRRQDTGRSRLDGPLKAFAVAGALIMCSVAATTLAGRAGAFSTDADVATRIARLTAGHTVLAPEPLAESLAADGARVWVSDPLDAFPASDQVAYIDFLLGSGQPAARAFDHVDLAVVTPGSPQAAVAERGGFHTIARIAAYDIDQRIR